LIAAGSHFWCDACVVARPQVEQSPDPRYCRGCYEILKTEAEMQSTKKAAWMPKDGSRKTAPKATQATPAMQGVVLQHPDHDNPPIIKKQVVLQHPGGRPRKVGSVHRVTKWRRDQQGVLI